MMRSKWFLVAVFNDMDSKEISELTKAVVQVAQMGEGLTNLAK